MSSISERLKNKTAEAIDHHPMKFLPWPCLYTYDYMYESTVNQ